MMTMIDEERLAVISAKIEKLMRLSTSPNEHEAALAAEKVQELLSTYNLDMLQVEKHTQNDPARSEERRVGKSVDLGGRRSIKKEREESEVRRCYVDIRQR